MKPFKQYQLKLAIALLLSVILQSCLDKAGSWKNAQIKAGKRDELHALSNDALKYLKANDFKNLKHMMSKEMIDDNSTIRTVELISNQLNDHSYQLLDEYYAINKYVDNDTIPATGTGVNSYSLSYPGVTREMYLAFFVPKTSENKYLISLIYADYNYGWKLYKIDVAPYTINGKTSPELFKLAKEKFNKNYLVDAVNDAALAISCLKPSDTWQYAGEDDLHKFYDTIINAANDKYKFPFTLKEVATKPVILRVYNQTNDEGSFPMIYYLSNIKLHDTVAIKKENDKIKKVIGKIIPGIDDDKKYILYSVFNERPTGRKAVDHFDITEKLP